MRGLGQFLRLCAGVVLLVACLAVGFVTTVGVMGIFSGFSPWFLLGIPLTLALLVGSVLLCDPLLKHWVFDWAFLAVLAALVPGGFVSPAIYQEHYGERTTAVVSSIGEVNGENGDVLKYMYRVRDAATGESLGTLAQAPLAGATEGDRLEVAVDPLGLVPPVAAGDLGGNEVWAIVIAGCFGVVVLAALANIASGFGALVSGRLGA